MFDPIEVTQKSPRAPWNKGKLIWAKPLSGRSTSGQSGRGCRSMGRTHDLAMFNLAIDSKLRGCDVVAIKGIGESATARLLSGSVDLADDHALRTARRNQCGNAGVDPSFGSTRCDRDGPGMNGSPKYCVSRATFPSLNSMMLTV